MRGLVDAALSDPWAAARLVMDEPLHPGGRDATADLLDRAGVDAGTRLLDVGCGAGDALAVGRERGATAVGLDRDPACGAVADERDGESDCERVVRGDMTSLPVADASVDVVLAECVLCLADDVDAALAESRRVLRPGGRLALSDVVVDRSLPPLPDVVAETLCLTGTRDRDRLFDAVGRAGFEVVETRDHREDLLAMRDRLERRVDYEGLLGVLGSRGREVRDAIDDLETAVEDGRIGYVSLVGRVG